MTEPVDTANSHGQQLAAEAQTPIPQHQPPSPPPVSSGSGRHHYLSTACQHLLHDKCRLVCKYGGEPCGCACHGEQIDKTPDNAQERPIIGYIWRNPRNSTETYIAPDEIWTVRRAPADPMSETTLGITPERRSTNIEPNHCGLCGMGWNEHPPATKPGTCLNFAPDEMKPPEAATLATINVPTYPWPPKRRRAPGGCEDQETP